MAKLLLASLVIALACLSVNAQRPRCPPLTVGGINIPVPVCTQTLLYDFVNQLDFTRKGNTSDTVKFDLLLASTIGLEIAAKTKSPFDRLNIQYTLAVFKMYGNQGNFNCLKTAYLKTLSAANNYNPAAYTKIAPLGVFFRALQGEASLPFGLPPGIGPAGLVALANAVKTNRLPIANLPLAIPVAQYIPVLDGASSFAKMVQPYFMSLAVKC